jgi:RNA-directed DNA polymerase
VKDLERGKPEPFDFLGFTHFCTRSRKWGSFVIGRKTIKNRKLKQLHAAKMEFPRRMHDSIAKTGSWLNYHAVSGNSPYDGHLIPSCLMSCLPSSFATW